MSIAELRFFLLPQMSGAVSWSTLSYMFSPLGDSGASDRLCSYYHQLPLTTYHWPLTKAESKEKHGVWEWDLMPELTVTSPYVLFIIDCNTFTMGNPRVDFIHRVRDLGFGLCSQVYTLQLLTYKKRIFIICYYAWRALISKIKSSSRTWNYLERCSKTCCNLIACKFSLVLSYFSM